jgi:hypothetical protein
MNAKFPQSLAVLALLSAPAAVIADTVAYDTMTGNVVSGSGNWFGYNAPLGGSYVIGDQFTSTATGYISGLELAMFSAGAGGPVALDVYSDSNGQIGTLLETLSVTTSGNWTSQNQGPYASGSYASGVTLNAGQRYWIVTPDVSPLAYWEYMAAPGSPVTPLTQAGGLFMNYAAGPIGSLTDGSSQYFPGGTPGALGLEVALASPVPLPAAGWLLLSALGGLGWIARRGGSQPF